MNNLNLLIKPSSGNCNINCNYCFYSDVTDNRITKNYGYMTKEIAEKLIFEAFNTDVKTINFAFQGGEPTLIGIDFFKSFHNFVNKLNTKNTIVNFSIQTNGILINKKWIELFKKYNYLVGVSLDGNKHVHDTFRKTFKKEGTFSQVYKNIKLLQKNNINFNILSVVNKNTVKYSHEIYSFFKKSHFKYLQFIPCLDKLNGDFNEDFSLTQEAYGEFLHNTFQLWYEDFKNGKYVSIRFFDNLISLILNNQPESCDMVGHCSINTVVEANGSIYPCDFYVLDEFKLGNIMTTSLSNLISSDKAVDFIKSSIKEHEDCKVCSFKNLCRSGCRRHKDFSNNYKNRFCESFKFFYSKNIPKLVEIANIIKFK